MKAQQKLATSKKSAPLTVTGMAIMAALTVTKAVPSSNVAGYSVLVGIAFFFIAEAVAKAPNAGSGLRFTTIAADMKKPGVLAWMLLPGVSGAATLIAGNLIFGGDFAAHVLGRTGSVLSFDKTALLAGQVILAAFGEEIAWRGFFLGQGAKILPFWLCAVVSSALFAAGHIAAGSTALVLYDVATIFIDSLIFSALYQKSGNCVISTFAHIFGNAVSLVAVFLFL